MNQSLYLGVDVAKSHLDFDAPVGRIANTPAAIAAVLSKLPAGTHLVCESTGGYEAELLARTLPAAVPVSVVPPQRVRHHARSMGRLAKTDRIDAALLTDYGRKHRPPVHRALEPERQHLRQLLRARTQVLELQQLETNWQEHANDLSALRRQAAQRIKLFAKQLAELEQAIRTLVATTAVLAPIQRLQQVQGVGEITAWTTWAEMPELGQLAAGQPAALAGLAPHPYDSGQKQGHRQVSQGRPQLRRLIELLNALIKNPNFILAH